MLRRFLQDPLFHFLCAGIVLFIFHSQFAGDRKDSAESTTIVVDETALLEFMQNRARVFAEANFRDRLKAMSEAERKRLIEDFVREEVLYREARAMGMDEGDYIIRRRLVQKVEFITETLSRETAALTDEDVAAFFREHQDEYFVEPTVTFTHVFFDAERHGMEKARGLAREKLAMLNDEAVRFEDAIRHGERFPFHLNYIERTPEFVREHFGHEAAEQILAMEVSTDRWQGPVFSPYGAHLVLLMEKAAGRRARLEEIEGRVRQDAELQRKQEIMKQATDELVEQYQVEIQYPIEP